jgi:hypothetical protein
MTTFDPASLSWTVGMLAGWTYDKPVNKWFQGQFRAAHRITRPCPTCSETIVLDVTTKALEGKATNHGLALRRCKACRGALKTGPAEYSERKALGAEKRAAEPEEVKELERLRKENAELKTKPAPSGDATSDQIQNAMLTQSVLVLQAENVRLKADYARVFAEVQPLKAELAKYKLGPAMEAAKPKFDPHAELAKVTAKNNSKIFPWGVDSP